MLLVLLWREDPPLLFLVLPLPIRFGAPASAAAGNSPAAADRCRYVLFCGFLISTPASGCLSS